MTAYHIRKAFQSTCAFCGKCEAVNNPMLTLATKAMDARVMDICESCVLSLRSALLMFRHLSARESVEYMDPFQFGDARKLLTIEDDVVLSEHVKESK